jgi:hypothetical protein
MVPETYDPTPEAGADRVRADQEAQSGRIDGIPARVFSDEGDDALFVERSLAAQLGYQVPRLLAERIAPDGHRLVELRPGSSPSGDCPRSGS